MHFSMKKSCKGKIIIAISAVLAAFLLVFVIYRIDRLYEMQADAFASNVGVEIINKAVVNVIGANPEYNSFTDLICNSQNRVTAAESDTILINAFKSQLTAEIIRLLDENPKRTVKISAANIFGVWVLGNRGIEIPIILAPVTDIATDFYDELKSGGINNIKHSLYIKVEIKLNIVGYFSQIQRTVSTSVPISETIIAAEVPSYYSAGGNMGYIPSDIK